jgi:hypothetical protein
VSYVRQVGKVSKFLWLCFRNGSSLVQNIGRCEIGAFSIRTTRVLLGALQIANSRIHFRRLYQLLYFGVKWFDKTIAWTWKYWSRSVLMCCLNIRLESLERLQTISFRVASIRGGIPVVHYRIQTRDVQLSKINIPRFRKFDYRRDVDWCMDLLTTYTHHSELQVINSAAAYLHNSQITIATAKPLSSLLSSSVVFWQWLLTVEILQLHVF